MKTCQYCLGTGKIIVNAGTGLKAKCTKCAMPKPETKPLSNNAH